MGAACSAVGLNQCSDLNRKVSEHTLLRSATSRLAESTLLRRATSHFGDNAFIRMATARLGMHHSQGSEDSFDDDGSPQDHTARSRSVLGKGVKEFRGLHHHTHSPSSSQHASSHTLGTSPSTSARGTPLNSARSSRHGHVDEETRKKADAFFQAARSGDHKKVKECLKHGGANVRLKTLRGQTALMLAASSHTRGTLDTVSFLIEHKSDLWATDDHGWTALHHACRNSEREVVSLLLQSNASVDVRAEDGKTAMMLAAMDGADQIVIELVEQKAGIDVDDNLGWSVLFFACADGRHELVKWLLKKQASAKDKTKDGMTPLMVVAEQGSRKIGKQLLKKSAQLNARNSEGNTALMLSLKAGNEDFADWLLKEGADVTVRNNEDEDAMEIADLKNMNTMKAKIEMKARGVQDKDEKGK